LKTKLNGIGIIELNFQSRYLTSNSVLSSFFPKFSLF